MDGVATCLGLGTGGIGLPSTITDDWTVADETAVGESLRIDQGTTSKSLTLSTTADTPPGTYRIALWGFTDCGLIACDDPGFPNITIPGMLSLTVTAPPTPTPTATVTTTSPSVTSTTTSPTVASTSASPTPTTSIPTSTAASTSTSTTSPSATVGNTTSVTPTTTVTSTSSPSPSVTPILLPATTTPIPTPTTPTPTPPSSSPTQSPTITVLPQPLPKNSTPTPAPIVTASPEPEEDQVGNETLSLSQSQGQPGDQFTIEVGGFTVGSSLTAWWDGYEQTLADGTMEWTGQTALTGGDTDAAGNLTLNVGVPTDTFTGPHTIVVAGNSGEAARADFSVSEAAAHPVVAAQTALLGPPDPAGESESTPRPPDATLLAILALANQATDPSDPPASTGYTLDTGAPGTVTIAQPRIRLGTDEDCRATLATGSTQPFWAEVSLARAETPLGCRSSSLEHHATAAYQTALDAIAPPEAEDGGTLATLLNFFRRDTFVDQFAAEVTGNAEFTIALSTLFDRIEREAPAGSSDEQYAYSVQTTELINLIESRLSEVEDRYTEGSPEHLEMVAILEEFQNRTLVPDEEPTNNDLKEALANLESFIVRDSEAFFDDLMAPDGTFASELDAVFANPVLRSVPYESDSRFSRVWYSLIDHCNYALRGMMSPEIQGTFLTPEVSEACSLLDSYRTRVRNLTGLNLTDTIMKLAMGRYYILFVVSDEAGNLTLKLYDPRYPDLPIETPLRGNREFIDAFATLIERVTATQRKHIIEGPESIAQTWNEARARNVADTFGIQVEPSEQKIDEGLRRYLWTRWLPAQFADQPITSRSEQESTVARALAANLDELALDFKSPASHPPRWTQACRISKPKILNTISLHDVNDDTHDQRHHLTNSTSQQTSVLEQMIQVDDRQPSVYAWFEGVGKLPSDGSFLCTYTLPKQGENYELKDTHFLAGALAGLNEHRYRTVRWSYGWWGRPEVIPAVAAPQGWTDEVATKYIPEFLRAAGYSGDVTNYHDAEIAQADPLVERFFAKVEEANTLAWEETKREVSSEQRLSFRCSNVCFVTPAEETPGIPDSLKEYWESLPDTMAALVDDTATASLPYTSVPTTVGTTVSSNVTKGGVGTAVAADSVGEQLVFTPTNYIRVVVDGASRGALLTDPSGRVAGFNPINAATLSTIQEATYSGPGERSRLFLPGLSHGTYQLTLFGLAAGEHTAKVTIAAGEEVMERTFTAHLDEGGQTTETFEIDLSDQRQIISGDDSNLIDNQGMRTVLLVITVILLVALLVIALTKKHLRRSQRRK